MSDYQARIALAREAYQATQPTPAEVKAGTARVESQLATPAHHMRRLLQFLGGGALLGAGLMAALSHSPGALAAGVGSQASLVDSSAAEPQGSAGSSPSLGLPAGWVQPIQLDPAHPAAATSEEPQARVSAQNLARPKLNGTSKPRTSPGLDQRAEDTAPPDWSQVSAALAAGDSAGAGKVLEGLAESQDADTRAKALLGQAQLALSRGDRADAKRLTRAAANVPGASAAVKEKALRWAARASL